MTGEIDNYKGDNQTEWSPALISTPPLFTWPLRPLSLLNNYEFYNITRNNHTDIHAKNQRKISSMINIKKEIFKYSSKINFETNIYNQFFNTEDKKIDSKYVTSNYFRSFPIFGITTETPFKIESFSISFSTLTDPSIGIKYSLDLTR